ncbi:glycosyltransferase [Arenimonas caeni]|jgi:GT2 family glycosyltransferase/glycosyltransferase involved in cell wall biosynthesis|uniref:glycosyltransferase n=1 Tax=Arenimonas caeni TaxID=2058085 RepID=UPI002A35DAFA|nr:glycosyltransferase [Arenimonas caeni]MDY0021666.1 glycosyltransferase [Arenimonas caeni]
MDASPPKPAARATASPLRLWLEALAWRRRRLLSLCRRGWASLRVRGLRGTLARLRPSPPPQPFVATAPRAPAAPGELRLPCPDAPRASIIVPVHGQPALTLACLQSLADSGDQAGFEVIVVDDASPAGTTEFLATIDGLRLRRNESNLGFIGSINAGAAMARGEYLVLLNNDTTVVPGWLDALLATFDAYPDTGAAGSKLVYPDGRLQEAGGIIFRDGLCWNHGRFEHPDDPRFNFVREVDYCSGAALAIPRALFARLGGLDAHFAPAYYEDADLGMRVRREGLRVRYQPASVVVHHEGASAGTDPTAGMKAHQAINRGRFVGRWREVLEQAHLPPTAGADAASERGRRHRVLVLDACTPMPDRDSGSVRMLALLRLLREEGCHVAFFNESGSHDGDYTRALQQLGVETWHQPWLGGLPRWLARHGAGFDLVVAARHTVLGPVLELLRLHAPRAALVFDTVDLHFLREQRAAELAGDRAGLRAAERTRRIELDLIARSDRTWVVSEAERQLLATLAPGARVGVVSNIHEPVAGGPGFEARSGLLFVGGFRHPPNVDAVRWLAAEILPRVRAREPGITLHVVGAEAPADIAALDGHDGIRVHGHVPDLAPLLRQCRLSVAPLRYGAGVKGKVNQALAHGLPVVATHCAVEGMHLREGEEALVADDAAAFADAVLRAHADAALWQRLSEGGLANTRRHFSPEAVRPVLRALLDGLPAR